MKPRELAKKLGIQLWTPVYHRGKGVGMKKDDDGTYIDLGDLVALTPMPEPIYSTADFDRWCESIRWPTCPNDHADPKAWIEGRDEAVRTFISAGAEVAPPIPPDTLIEVGMLADVEGHGDGLPIEAISIALCPRRDPAAEGNGIGSIPEGLTATAVEVPAIEAALLPYAVFDFGKGGWAYGRQIRRVYNEDGSDHEG